MTQISISQWLLNQQYPKQQGINMTTTQPCSPRYQIVSSNKFYGHFDVLDTHTGKREPCGNLRTARATVLHLNK